PSRFHNRAPTTVHRLPVTALNFSTELNWSKYRDSTGRYLSAQPATVALAPRHRLFTKFAFHRGVASRRARRHPLNASPAERLLAAPPSHPPRAASAEPPSPPPPPPPSTAHRRTAEPTSPRFRLPRAAFSACLAPCFPPAARRVFRLPPAALPPAVRPRLISAAATSSSAPEFQQRLSALEFPPLVNDVSNYLTWARSAMSYLHSQDCAEAVAFTEEERPTAAAAPNVKNMAPPNAAAGLEEAVAMAHDAVTADLSKEDTEVAPREGTAQNARATNVAGTTTTAPEAEDFMSANATNKLEINLAVTRADDDVDVVDPWAGIETNMAIYNATDAIMTSEHELFG
ncbi:MAG: hypothetical protein BJ554DRAFT_467, partial [Olpidium bornovanus]